MIFVFKTSVKTNRQLQLLKTHINNTLPNAKWNFDLDDVDKILRIESDDNIASIIIALLQKHNYSCEELI